jgi:hypothetical protein
VYDDLFVILTYPRLYHEYSWYRHVKCIWAFLSVWACARLTEIESETRLSSDEPPTRIKSICSCIWFSIIYLTTTLVWGISCATGCFLPYTISIRYASSSPSCELYCTRPMPICFFRFSYSLCWLRCIFGLFSTFLLAFRFTFGKMLWLNFKYQPQHSKMYFICKPKWNQQI